jgi:hypothetical protein
MGGHLIWASKLGTYRSSLGFVRSMFGGVFFTLYSNFTHDTRILERMEMPLALGFSVVYSCSTDFWIRDGVQNYRVTQGNLSLNINDWSDAFTRVMRWWRGSHS